MPNYTVAGLRSYYLTKWNNLVITRPGPINAAANQIIAGQEVYKALQSKTGVPWYMIGVIHYRESNCNFHTHLHNGDPLSARTRHVPAGRPPTGSPPFDFQYSAIDALTYEGFTRIKSWPIEQIAYSLEQYNGWGYRYRGYPSAYLWSGTNQYRAGKFVADGVFNGEVVDVQNGCMAILKRIFELTGEKPVSTIQTPYNNEASAEIPDPTPGELNQVSRKHWYTDIFQKITGGMLGFGAVFKTVDVAQIQAVQTYLNTVKSFANEYGWFFVIILLLMIATYLSKMKELMKQDYKDGRFTPSGATEVAAVPSSTPVPIPEAVDTEQHRDTDVPAVAIFVPASTTDSPADAGDGAQ